MSSVSRVPVRVVKRGVVWIYGLSSRLIVNMETYKDIRQGKKGR